jgi:hypothetical protein
MNGRWEHDDASTTAPASVAIAPARVGAEWWHSSSDRQAAVAQLSTDFLTFQSDLVAAIAARAGSLTPEQKRLDDAWVSCDVQPTLAEWQAFAARESDSWLTRLTTSWDVFEEWMERLRRLRALARAHGLELQSAEPVDLPRTVWQRGTSGGGSASDTWLGFLKVVVYSAVGITGFATLYSVLRDLRGRHTT